MSRRIQLSDLLATLNEKQAAVEALHAQVIELEQHATAATDLEHLREAHAALLSEDEANKAALKIAQAGLKALEGHVKILETEREEHDQEQTGLNEQCALLERDLGTMRAELEKARNDHEQMSKRHEDHISEITAEMEARHHKELEEWIAQMGESRSQLTEQASSSANEIESLKQTHKDTVSALKKATQDNLDKILAEQTEKLSLALAAAEADKVEIVEEMQKTHASLLDTIRKENQEEIMSQLALVERGCEEKALLQQEQSEQRVQEASVLTKSLRSQVVELHKRLSSIEGIHAAELEDFKRQLEVNQLRNGYSQGLHIASP